jgi:hypothetical protein
MKKDFILNNSYNLNSKEFFYGPSDLLENLESYKDVRVNLIKKEKNLLDLNLQTMRISYY